MRIVLKNDELFLTLDTHGAQMLSLIKDGIEHLWQGDPKYWPDRAPVLFPFIGRLWRNAYSYKGKTYRMGIHGFAAQSEFALLEQTEESVVLSLTGDAVTLASYPFGFKLDIAYRLIKNTVRIIYSVYNLGIAEMPFGIGGHPGFRVPWDETEQFEDYYLEFENPCRPVRIGFTPALYLSGSDEQYPLEDGKRLLLEHELFDDDAIVLKNVDHTITLRSKKNRRSVTVTYQQMPYLGIWHTPNSDAPYVCIEPWSSLPGRQDIVEEFSAKADLIQLASGQTYRNTWSITIG